MKDIKITKKESIIMTLFLSVILLTINSLFLVSVLSLDTTQNQEAVLLDTNQSCHNFLKGNGNSMYPNINSGDIAEADTCYSAHDLRVGDIIIFREYGLLVAHRIIGINFDDRVLITKGDNNDYADEVTNFNQFYGKIIKIYKCPVEIKKGDGMGDCEEYNP